MAEKKKQERPTPEQNQPPEAPATPQGGKYQKPRNLKATTLRVLKYMLYYHPWMAAATVFFTLLSSASGVAGMYVLRPIINGLTEAAMQGETVLPILLPGALALVGCYAVMAVSVYLQYHFLAQMAHRGCNRLRWDLFEKLQDMPLSYFDRHPHGELMSRFTNDADRVQSALDESPVALLSSILTVAATVLMMAILNPLLFLITAAVLAAVMFSFRKLGGLGRENHRQQQTTLGALNGCIQEDVEGLKVIKAFTHEQAARQEFNRRNENFRDAAMRATFYTTVIFPVTAQLSNVGFAVTACVGGALALLAGFDVGGLVVFLGYTKQLSEPMNQISMQMTTLLSALAGAERMFAVMDAPPEQDEGKVTLVTAHRENGVLTEGAGEKHRWAWKVPQPDGSAQLVELKGEVRFRDVCFGYLPEKEVLHHIDVYAKPGQKIAFVGSTGAGKTTITNLINRFYEIQSGTITYDGINVQDIEKDSLRRSLGAVLQDTHLFTGTVMDNIRYGRLDATDEECIAAAKTANAHSFIRRLPDGYQTMVTGDGSNLSQGQRQLLAIARAAVADPPVMVLDEATSSIDTRTEALISEGMDALMEGRTVFVIAHRLSTVRNADAIAVIEAGRILEKGDHHALLEQQGRYYQLYTGQFRLT